MASKWKKKNLQHATSFHSMSALNIATALLSHWMSKYTKLYIAESPNNISSVHD